jgi:hypothetical protein
MTQAKATARPWRIAHKASDYTYIEQAGGNFLTIAKVTDVVERDANAELIVTAVNERDALLSEVAQLREAVRWMLDSRGAYLFHEDECPWNYGPDGGCNCRVLKARELAKGKVTSDGK